MPNYVKEEQVMRLRDDSTEHGEFDGRDSEGLKNSGVVVDR